MRRIIHNTTAIVACLSLMAPHAAMARTLIPEHAAQERADKNPAPASSKEAGMVLAQAEEQPAEEQPVPLPEADEAAPEAPAPAEVEAPAEEPEAAAPAEPEAPVEAETPEPAEAEVPAEAEAPAPAAAEEPAEAEAAAPAEAEAPAEPETPAAVEAEEPAEAEAAAPTEAEAPVEAQPPAAAEAEAPAEAEAEATTPAEAEAEVSAEAEAEAEAPAEADAEATEPVAPVKKPAASESQPEQTGEQDLGDAADGAASDDEGALAEALSKEEKASEEGGQQNDPAAADATEPTEEDALAEALAKEEKAAEETEEQPAATEGEEKADNAATDDAATDKAATDKAATDEAATDKESATDESAAEDGDETATETSAEAEVPADLSALSEDSGEGEVTEETVTEENSRSSSEDFSTNLAEALSGATDQEAQKSKDDDDDDDDNKLAKAALLGLGGLAIGAMLSNNRQVELSTPDRLVVTHPDGSQEVIKDETALLRQPGSTVTTENFDDGSSRTTVTRADGSKVVTIRDGNLRVLRRTLVAADGNSMALIDDTAAAVPVDIASLPAPAEPVQSSGDALNEDELRAALLSDVNAGRQFTLGQIRNISEVRALVAPINIDAITFDTGSAAIKADQAKQLSTLGKVIQQAIQENPQEIFLIEGHTDSVGDAAMNLALSDRRAESVALALTEYFDVTPENLVTQGYGEQFPKVEAEGESRENRRASIRRITELLQTASTE